VPLPCVVSQSLINYLTKSEMTGPLFSGTQLILIWSTSLCLPCMTYYSATIEASMMPSLCVSMIDEVRGIQAEEEAPVVEWARAQPSIVQTTSRSHEYCAATPLCPEPARPRGWCHVGQGGIWLFWKTMTITASVVGGLPTRAASATGSLGYFLL
jgi:hypothetical protein